jgi:hypothetical protein
VAVVFLQEHLWAVEANPVILGIMRGIVEMMDFDLPVDETEDVRRD